LHTVLGQEILMQIPHMVHGTSWHAIPEILREGLHPGGGRAGSRADSFFSPVPPGHKSFRKDMTVESRAVWTYWNTREAHKSGATFHVEIRGNVMRDDWLSARVLDLVEYWNGSALVAMYNRNLWGVPVLGVVGDLSVATGFPNGSPWLPRGSVQPAPSRGTGSAGAPAAGGSVQPDPQLPTREEIIRLARLNSLDDIDKNMQRGGWSGPIVICPACGAANRQGVMFCLSGCSRWFAFLGGEYDSWYLDGVPIVSEVAQGKGEHTKWYSRRVQQEAAQRLSSMQSMGFVTPTVLDRQARFGSFVKVRGAKSKASKDDYDFRKHYFRWCHDEPWRLERAAKGITRNHKTAVLAPGGWTPLEWDEEHQDTIWNTAVIIGNNGSVIGKHRKVCPPQK
jgi:hypothetical protein